jgi:DNA-binding MarR family transcriptional regulator
VKHLLSRSQGKRQVLVSELVVQARKASTRAVLLHTAIADRLGLNPSDHKCADLLSSENGVSTPGRLAELTGLSTGAVTGVLDRLERAGFVAREPDPDDRRRTIVMLTPKNMPDMARIFAPLVQGMERLCNGYSVEELTLILRFLREQEKMADQAIGEVREAVAKTRREK